jgi:sulfur carrier protein
MQTIKTFFLNGQEYSSKDKFTLLDLLHYFNYNLTTLVLERNNFICSKQNWNNILVENDDRIEIVTIVGGG